MRTWPYPAIVAHRGGGKLAPENTLEAIDGRALRPQDDRVRREAFC